MSDRHDDPPTEPRLEYLGVSGVPAIAEAALEVIDAARYNLALMTVDLDRGIYGTEAFTQHLRNFVLQHRRAQLRVLVHEPVAAVRNSIRLVEFGRLLSSRIEFRRVPQERRKLREEYLIADERALLYRRSSDEFDAKHYTDAPMVARSHLREFEAIWHESPVARELTALGI